MPDGSRTAVRLVHFSKAPVPIYVMLSPMVIRVSSVLFSNAWPAILVTVFPPIWSGMVSSGSLPEYQMISSVSSASVRQVKSLCVLSGCGISNVCSWGGSSSECIIFFSDLYVRPLCRRASIINVFQAEASVESAVFNCGNAFWNRDGSKAAAVRKSS